MGYSDPVLSPQKMATTQDLGARLKARRLELGLKLAEVKERSGLSLPYIANLERGRGNPTADALRKLATALETNTGALLGEIVGNEERVSQVLESVVSMPRSLVAFSKSSRFRERVERLAKETGGETEDLRGRLLIAMASAPRRSAGEPTVEDWNRLLDTFDVILRG